MSGTPDPEPYMPPPDWLRKATQKVEKECNNRNHDGLFAVISGRRLAEPCPELGQDAAMVAFMMGNFEKGIQEWKEKYEDLLETMDVKVSQAQWADWDKAPPTILLREKLREAEAKCPCLNTDPCHPDCTCVQPHMSRGCRRCCKYGSAEQRAAKARWLVAAMNVAEEARKLRNSGYDGPFMGEATEALFRALADMENILQ